MKLKLSIALLLFDGTLSILALLFILTLVFACVHRVQAEPVKMSPHCVDTHTHTHTWLDETDGHTHTHTRL